MSSKSTPDERFLIRLYEEALKRDDLFEPIDYRTFIASLGIKEKAAQNIIKHLAQANFVKKRGESLICLTERGSLFAKSALDLS